LVVILTSLSVISSPDDIGVIWAGHVACVEEMRNAYGSKYGNPEGSCRGTWEDNIKTDLTCMGYVNMIIWFIMGPNGGLL
jgi:hypothetical protein